VATVAGHRHVDTAKAESRQESARDRRAPAGRTDNDTQMSARAKPHSPGSSEPCAPVRVNPWNGLHNPVTLPYRLGPEDPDRERSCLTLRLPCPRAQRRLPSAELLPALAVVVAGRDQGSLPRAGEHRRALRPRGAQPEPGDEAAERGVAQDLREA